MNVIGMLYDIRVDAYRPIAQDELESLGEEGRAKVARYILPVDESLLGISVADWPNMRARLEESSNPPVKKMPPSDIPYKMTAYQRGYLDAERKYLARERKRVSVQVLEEIAPGSYATVIAGDCR